MKCLKIIHTFLWDQCEGRLPANNMLYNIMGSRRGRNPKIVNPDKKNGCGRDSTLDINKVTDQHLRH
jgi:hypothetical protein